MSDEKREKDTPDGRTEAERAWDKVRFLRQTLEEERQMHRDACAAYEDRLRRLRQDFELFRAQVTAIAQDQDPTKECPVGQEPNPLPDEGGACEPAPQAGPRTEGAPAEAGSPQVAEARPDLGGEG
jgi:hypothetical protein